MQTNFIATQLKTDGLYVIYGTGPTTCVWRVPGAKDAETAQ